MSSFFHHKSPLATYSIGTPDATGHGSTRTRIRYFAGTPVETGLTIVTRASSAANGDSFTIAADGIYSVQYTDTGAGGTDPQFGVSINTTAYTTSVFSLSPTVLLAGIQGVNGKLMTVTWVGRLNVGDVLQCHTNGWPDGVSANQRLIIPRIGA